MLHIWLWAIWALRLAALQLVEQEKLAVALVPTPTIDVSFYPDGPELKAFARTPDKAACRDCCPRAKATVTVTETGYTTITCTHTHSSDRIQTTTVRFTSTASVLATSTERVNFINTTTVVVSTQVTFFETTELAKYRIFTKTQTIFTSFAIATAFRTTRSASTRTLRTLSLTTLTGTVFTTLSTQFLETVTLTSDVTVEVVSLTLLTVTRPFTTTSTVTAVSFVATTLPNSTQYFTNSITLVLDTITIVTNVLVLNTVDDREPTAQDIITPKATVTTFLTTNTGNVVQYASATTVLTFSELYPLTFI